MEGEVEIVRTNLSKLYYNADAGVVAVSEENAKGRLIRSEMMQELPENKEGIFCSTNVGGSESLGKYVGTEFYVAVQSYLASRIDKSSGFKDKSRSKFNQQAFKEIILGVYGVGKTFGDIDAYKERKYMYTMRARTRNVRYWSVSAGKFVLHI